MQSPLNSDQNRWSKGLSDPIHSSTGFPKEAVAHISDDLTEEPRVANENSYENRRSCDNKSQFAISSQGAIASDDWLARDSTAHPI